jgi:hypothetical protein
MRASRKEAAALVAAEEKAVEEKRQKERAVERQILKDKKEAEKQASLLKKASQNHEEVGAQHVMDARQKKIEQHMAMMDNDQELVAKLEEEAKDLLYKAELRKASALDVMNRAEEQLQLAKDLEKKLPKKNNFAILAAGGSTYTKRRRGRQQSLFKTKGVVRRRSFSKKKDPKNPNKTAAKGTDVKGAAGGGSEEGEKTEQQEGEEQPVLGGGGEEGEEEEKDDAWDSVSEWCVQRMKVEKRGTIAVPRTASTMIYQGTKFFWRSQQHVDVFMYEAESLNRITIISLDTGSHEEFPKIYVDIEEVKRNLDLAALAKMEATHEVYKKLGKEMDMTTAYTSQLSEEEIASVQLMNLRSAICTYLLSRIQLVKEVYQEELVAYVPDEEPAAGGGAAEAAAGKSKGVSFAPEEPIVKRRLVDAQTLDNGLNKTEVTKVKLMPQSNDPWQTLEVKKSDKRQTFGPKFGEHGTTSGEKSTTREERRELVQDLHNNLGALSKSNSSATSHSGHARRHASMARRHTFNQEELQINFDKIRADLQNEMRSLKQQKAEIGKET